jgi:predicted permease
MFRLPESRERLTRELDEEVRFHVEMRVARLIAEGVPYDEARAEALRRFGDVEDLRDYCQTIEDAHMQRARAREQFATLGQDARFALRQFRKSPGFAFVAVITLALGIGATTAIFSVVNGVVLQPLPFEHPEQIVQVMRTDGTARQSTFADPTFDFLAEQNRSFSALAEYSSYPMSISSGSDALRVTASVVSKQFWDVLNVHAAVGRLFVPEEQQRGAPLALVISNRLWTRQFGASHSAIGSKVMNGSTIATIVGVLPPGQEFPATTDVWYPREVFGKDESYTAHNWRVVGRVKNRVTIAQASQDVSTLLQRLHAQVGQATVTLDGEAVSLREQIVGKIKPLLLLILGASGVLLLIACTNVANLLIARMAVRENEIAVRLSIGAGRARLAQQLLVETAFLSAAGCIAGLVFAFAGVRALLVLQPSLIPRVGEVRLDWRVGAFAVLLAAATAIGLGLLAAWRAGRGDLRAALSQSQRTQGGGGASYRIRGSLVVTQLAMTVVLLIGAALLARSFVRLMTLNTGFRTSGVVVATLGLESGSGAERVARRAQYYDDIARRAEGIPGVTNVGFSNAEPFAGGSSNGTYVVLSGLDVKLTFDDLEPLLRDKSRTGYANFQMVSGGYFKAMGVPLLSGRLMDDRDRRDAPHVAVINATLAKRQWPNESPIGKAIEFGNIDGDLTPLTVIGVVGDTREEQLAAEPPATIYVSYRQRPGNDNGVFVVMSTTAEASTIATARQLFRQVRADVPMRFQTIEEIVGRSVATQRFMLLVVGVFGGVALLLASLGVYSVISYLVTQRGRELSIRVALGARGGDILRLVLRQGIQLAAIGLVIGGVASLFATRLLTELLYQVTPTDPIAFGAMVAILGAVAVVASYIPARRAARVQPMDVLRSG